MQSGDLVSKFCAAGRLLSSIVATVGPFVTFCELPMHLEVLLSTSFSLPCYPETHELPSIFCRSGRILSTFLAANRSYVTFWQPSMRPGYLVSNFPCSQENFCQVSLWSGDFPSTSVKFPCNWETFHQLPSTFLAIERSSTSVNLL